MPEPTLNNVELDRYAPPKTRVADTYAANDATQPIHLFSTKGRMGRLRFICWSGVFVLVFFVVSAVVMFLTFSEPIITALIHHTAVQSESKPGVYALIGVILMMIIGVFWFVFIIRLMIQRSHDMGWSGWSILFMYIFAAVIGIFGGIAMAISKSFVVMMICMLVAGLLPLIWVIKPGTSGPNRFGPPPVPTPLVVQIVAWIFVILGVLDLIFNLSQMGHTLSQWSQMSQLH